MAAPTPTRVCMPASMQWLAGRVALLAGDALCLDVVADTFRSHGANVVRAAIAASSRDTVRSKHRTGKYSRQLRSSWHDAWEAPGAPAALPLPLMSMVAEPAFALINKAAQRGNAQARELVTYFVGQGVGLVDGVKSAARVVQEFKEDFAEAVATTMAFME